MGALFDHKVMDSQLRHDLALAFQCLPENRRQAYGNESALRYPNERNTIDAIYQCQSEGRDVIECVDSFDGDNQAIAPVPDTVLQYCRRYAERLGERAISDQTSVIDFYDILRNDLYATDRDSNLIELGHAERVSMNRMAEFYARRLPATYLNDLREHLRSSPDRSISPQRLRPFTCSNADQWRRHDVRIDGLSYMVPVFMTRDDATPRWYYDHLIKIGFEVLKAFMTPTDLDRLLHPQNGSHDLSIYIGGPNETRSGPLFEACGVSLDMANGERAGGRYTPNRHQISIFSAMEFPFGYQLNSPGDILAGNMLGTFVHEMAHAIDFAFLDSDSRSAIRQYVRAVVDAVGDDSSRYSYIPRYYEVQGDGSGWSWRDYGTRNHMEWFAEMVTEYVINEVRGMTIAGESYDARRSIMHDFFASSGINLQAFTTDRVLAAHRAAGADIDFDLSGLSLTIPQMGYQTFSGNVGDRSVSGGGMMIGVHGGYLYHGMPRGFVGGGGALLDFTLGMVGDLNDGLLLDAGLWGRLGGNTGPVDLYVEPQLGLRHANIEDADETTFWLGGQAGLGFFQGSFNLFGMARFSPDNWQSYGGGIALDIGAIIQQAP